MESKTVSKYNWFNFCFDDFFSVISLKIKHIFLEVLRIQDHWLCFGRNWVTSQSLFALNWVSKDVSSFGPFFKREKKKPRPKPNSTCVEFFEFSEKSELLKEVILCDTCGITMCKFYNSFRHLLIQTNTALPNALTQLIEIKLLEIRASIFNDILNIKIFIWGRNQMHLDSSIMFFFQQATFLFSSLCIKGNHLLLKCSLSVIDSAIFLKFFAWPENIQLQFAL